MARETKVGLLAGLAFIVCFAVILANRGQLNSRSGSHTFLTKTDKPAGSRTRNNTQKTNRYANTRSHSPQPASRANPTTRHAQRPPTRVDITPPSSRRYQPSQRQSSVTGPTDGQQQLPERIQSYGVRSNTPPLAGSTSQDANGLSSLTSPTWSTADNTANDRTVRIRPRANNHHAVEERGRSVDELIRYAAGAIVPVTRPSFNRSDTRALYQVKAGDTLYKIAARQLGKASRRNVDAIFDANRSTLSSPDQLKVGMKIVIPSMTAQETSPRVASTMRSKKSKPARRSPGFRWYQIKKNDRYINIARNELGDAKRWHEIHDLNKRNFPDPDKIRAGVRIKLPLLNAVASSRPGS